MIETQTGIEQVWTELEAIVGREHLQPASPRDAIDGIQPVGVVVPGTAQEVAKILLECSSAGLAVVPRGGGTKLWLGNRPQKVDLILSTERLNRVIEHAWGDMTATVEAGCTIDNFQRVLHQHGQRLAADPIQPEAATVGGLLATAESGTLRIRYGAVRDLVLGVEMALPDGSVIKAGGKVVKNVAGYDLNKLVIGSLGTLGVITRAVFRLHSIPVATATYSATVTTASKANKVVLAILDSQLVYTGLQVRAQGAGEFAIDMRFEGIPESLRDQYVKLGHVVAGCTFADATDDVWLARQRLFLDTGSSVTCKCSVLPAQIGALCDAIFRHSESAQVAATVVVQGTGVGEVCLDASRQPPTAEMLTALRGELDRLQGTLIVQQCPVSMKQSLDVWGPLQDALPLMRQIKTKFDPGRTLNPGRYVGAI